MVQGAQFWCGYGPKICQSPPTSEYIAKWM